MPSGSVSLWFENACLGRSSHRMSVKRQIAEKVYEERERKRWLVPRKKWPKGGEEEVEEEGVGGGTEGKVVLTVGGEDSGTGREEEGEKNWCEGNSRGLKATSREI